MEHDQLIRNRMVVGIADTRLSEPMQLEKNLDLEKSINMVRQWGERSVVSNMTWVLWIVLLKAKNKKKSINSENPKVIMLRHTTFKIKSPHGSQCYKCEGNPHPKQMCPTKDENCNFCGKKGPLPTHVPCWQGSAWHWRGGWRLLLS